MNITRQEIVSQLFDLNKRILKVEEMKELHFFINELESIIKTLKSSKSSLKKGYTISDNQQDYLNLFPSLFKDIETNNCRSLISLIKTTYCDFMDYFDDFFKEDPNIYFEEVEAITPLMEQWCKVTKKYL